MNAIDDYEKGFNQCSTLVLHLEEKNNTHSGEKNIDSIVIMKV